MENALIEIEDLSVLKNGKEILAHVNLSIGVGEKVLVRGESGGGKSTLMRAILFFERFSGRVLYNQQEVGTNNFSEFRNHIGYVGQTLPGFQDTVDRVLNIPYAYRTNRRLHCDEDRKMSLLKTLNFQKGVLSENYADLSGGEKQRILILQILLVDKPVVFFDEVTAALDPKNIESAVREITANEGKTVISISHNKEWERYCTRVIDMGSGKIISDTGRWHGGG